MIGMRRFTYPVTLTPAENFAAGEAGFIVTFADFPEAITQGKDTADAFDQAADALEEAEKGVRRIYTALAQAREAVAGTKWSASPLPQELLVELQQQVEQRLVERRQLVELQQQVQPQSAVSLL